MPTLQFIVVIAISFKKLFSWYWHPLSQLPLFSFLLLFKCKFFLKKMVADRTSSDCNINKIVLPTILKEVRKLLLQVFQSLFIALPFSWGKTSQKLLLDFIFAGLFNKFQNLSWRCGHLSIVVKSYQGAKVVAKIEGMLDFVANVCWFVVRDEATKSILDKISSLASTYVRLWLSFSWFYLSFCHFFLKVSQLKFFLEHINRN